MRAPRYADGRAAIDREVQVTIGADALTILIDGVQAIWPYAGLRRCDDDNDRLILRPHPDTGERLTLDALEMSALKAAAPQLFKSRALGRESNTVIGALAAGAWSIAAVFLIGVPLAAKPIARIMPETYRDQISTIAWAQVEAITQECDAEIDAAGYDALYGLASRLADGAEARVRDDLFITVVSAPFPNAFALPDGSIVITDQLIALAEHQDEIAGVLAHELGHIDQNHVLANVVRNTGAGVFFDIVFGGAGLGQIAAVASVNLASLSYSRDDEAEADLRGFDFLDAAGIDPGGMARLFERMADLDPGEASGPAFLRSHPANADRAAAARARAHAGLAPSISDGEWAAVRAMCGTGEENPTPAAPTPPAPAPPPDPAAPIPTQKPPLPAAPLRN